MLLALGNQKPVLGSNVFVAHNATLIGSVVLDDLASVWFNVVIRGDNDVIHVGEGSNVQDACVLHTDPGFPLTLGHHVSVGHHAMLHGCTIGDESLIGINSVVLNGATIGAHCLVGANTLVTEGKSIPDYSLVVGSPGRIIRRVTEDECETMRNNAESYINKNKRYQCETTEITNG